MVWLIRVRAIFALPIALLCALGLLLFQPAFTAAARPSLPAVAWLAGPGGAGTDAIRQAPADLTVVKTNNVGGQTTAGSTWTWVFTIRNTSGLTATFTPGQTVLLDNLPNASVNYPSIFATAFDGASGTLACVVDGSANLTCQPSGGNVTLPAGSRFEVTMQANTLIPGVYVDPRAGGVCRVDPNGVVAESNEGNNNCSDSVTVVGPDLTAVKTNNVAGTTGRGSPWIWTIVLTNSGNTPASFASGQRFLLDALPTPNVTYGAPTVAAFGGALPNVACSIDGGANLTCQATPGDAIIPVGGGYTIAFQAVSSIPATYANPRAGGTCLADPDGLVGENSEANNACANSVTVTGPDLTATKTNDVGGIGTVGVPWTWTVAIANGGSASASFTAGQTVLVDHLPNSGLTYGVPGVTAVGAPTGTLNCAIDGAFTLTCSAAAGGVTMPTGSSFNVSFTATAGSAGAYSNPRSGGVCQADPIDVVAETNDANNTCANGVTVGAPALPDLSASKSNNVAGVSTIGTPWTWTIQVANSAVVGTGTANFANGQAVLVDSLPATGLTYGPVTATAADGASGTVTCIIDGTTTLVCTASGAVTMPPGARYAVTFAATPTTGGTYVNPRAGGVCQADPNGAVAESNESNNACANGVTVGAPVLPDLSASKSNNVAGVSTIGTPWSWTIQVANSALVGTGTAIFANGQAVLVDNLPPAGVTYGPATATAAGGATGTVTCIIDGTTTLVCTASGAVTMPPGARYTVTFVATPTAGGTYANPRAGGVCQADPNGAVAESNESNNACSDSVAVSASPGSPAPVPGGASGVPSPSTPVAEAQVTPEDDDDKPRLSEIERHQRQRTNASSQEDERTEGNVLEVRCDASSPPYYEVSFTDHVPYIVIATRDGNQQLRLTKKAARDQCQYVRVGDYVEAEGDKEHELLFNAHDLTTSR